MSKIRKLIAFFIVLAVLCYFLPALLFPLAKDKVQNYLQNYFKTEVSLEKVSVNLLTRNVILEKPSIKNTKEFGRGNLLEAKEVIIQPKILSFIRKKPAVSIILNEPRLNLHRLTTGETNWDFFWGKKETEITGKPLILSELLIKNGTFRYVEEHNPQRLAVGELQGLFIHLRRYGTPLTHLENIPLNSKIKGRGYLPTEPKGTLHFNGKVNLEEKKPSFLGNITMDNISLTYFNDFYPEEAQIKVVQGKFSLASHPRCIQDQLYAQPEVTVKELRLKLTSEYDTGDVFELPVALVVDFFDLYKEELKFTFEVKGTLTDPKFQLGDVVAQKVSQIIGESITRTIATSPTMVIKLGDKLKGMEKTLKKLGITIGTSLKKGASTAVKPAKELIKGLKGKESTD